MVEPQSALDALRDTPEADQGKLAEVRERVVALLYTLMRDMLPTGAMQSLVDDLSAHRSFEFSAEELEALARRYTDVLLGDGVAVMPKEKRDWLDSFPERVRSSPEFEVVLREVGSVPLTEKSKAGIIAEVVKRQKEAVRA